MSQAARMLLLKNVVIDAELVETQLHQEKIGYVSKRVETRAAFIKELADLAPDIVISDYTLSQFKILETLHLHQQHKPDLPFMLASQTDEVAVKCLKSGADDYLLKTELQWLPAIGLNTLQKRATKQAQEQAGSALRESQRQLSGPINCLPGIGFSWPINLKSSSTKDLSEGCLALTGYRSEELISNESISDQSITHPEDRPKIVEVMQIAIAQKQPYGVEYRIRTKLGPEKWLWEKGQGVFDNHGELLRLEGLIIDISDRKQMEETLRKSEEQFRCLSACSPVGIFLTDLEGRCTYTNPRYQAISGFTFEEALGEGYVQSIHPGDRAQVVTDWSACVATRQEYSGEYRCQTKEGVVCWVHTRVAPMFSDLGELIGYVGTIEDIAEHKRTEEGLQKANEANEELETRVEERTAELTQANQQLQAEITEYQKLEVQLRRRERELTDFVENAAVGLHWVGADGIIRWANRAELELLGYCREEYVGQHIANFHADPEVIKDILQRLTANETLRDYEARLRCRDGSIRHVLIDSNVFWEDGQFIHTQCFTRDISVAKHLEKARKQAEEKISFQAHLLDVVGQAVVATDLEGAIIYWNQFAETLYGWSADEVLGRPIVEVTPARAWADHADEIMNHLRAGESSVGEFLLQRRDNSTFTGTVTTSPIHNHKGALIGIISVFTDITERKQAEEALATRERQQAVVAQLGQMALADVDLSMLMDEAVFLGAHCLEVEYSKVLELLPGRDTLLLRAGVGWRSGLVGQATVEAGIDSQAGYTLLSSAPVVVEDLGTETRFSGPPLLQDHGVVSGLSVIIRGQKHPFGVFGVHTTQQRTFTEDDIYFLQAVANVLATAIDRQRAEEALRESQEQLQAILDNSTAVIYMMDTQNRYILVNRRYEELFHITKEQIIGQTLDENWPQEIADALTANNQKALEAGMPIELEEVILQDDGLHTYISIKVPIHNAAGVAYAVCGVSTDITERKRTEEAVQKTRDELEIWVRERTAELAKANEELQAEIAERQRVQEQLLHDAFHDALTGLANRALFMDRLEHAVERAKRHPDYLFAVLFLDLDRFKVINDSLGHLIGDQLLISIAHRLEVCLRPIDTIARLGGDEFTILLEDIKDISEVIPIADRIQRSLALPVNLNGHEVFTNGSIGITLNTTGYDQPEQLLRDADIAMYHAKELGRARYQVFDPGMHNRVVELLRLETDLRRAIERQEFQVHYQPIVMLATGTIVGFEALIRWQHPKRGLVFPAEFISVAEETGLIFPIGRWVLHEACRQMRQWQAQFPMNPPLTLNVNLSSKQLFQPDLIEQINQILQETGLDARSLKLEITESGVMENAELATTLLLQLRALDIQLAIDDFGTGYSSLSYLHQFPIDTLKIDCSFVSRIGVDHENLEIVQTIVTLADNLGINVTAEGTETAQQLAQLRSLECKYGQGYFFSPPLDSTAVEALIAAQPQW
jgi:diguanylate cyclase (GGDEF)-like protein/PAS domain S-box-containing protein